MPSLAGVIARPRLLDAVGERPIVAISAPAGSGTTTLAAQVAAGRPGATAWCRLAPGFDHVGDVIESAASATDVDLGIAPSRVVDAAERLLDLFESGPVTLVVDDHHLAANGDIDRVIAECADLLPSEARIVVAGASRPAGLIGLVSPRKLAVIGPEDLAFTDDEAVTLFDDLGRATDHTNGRRAAEWRLAVAGWAQAMVAGACSPDADPTQHLDALLDQHAATPPASDLLAAACALPYVTGSLVAAVIGVEAPTLDQLVADSPLLTDHDGFVRMSDDAAARLRARLGDERVAELRRAAAPWLVEFDPVTAIDVLLDAGLPDEAADVLADHLSEIGVERALTWLYRLPAELRRRFPPVLAAGQATVEVDTALATAQLRVETADSDRSRREALLALGSIEAHRGELAAAATALESALRASRDDEHARRRISFELARTRFLLGDVTGARSALADAEASTFAALLGTQLDIVDESSGATTIEGDDAFADAARSLRALATGDSETADATSERAYASASEVGGEALVEGAVARSLALVRSGRGDEAEVIIDEMERRLGARHRLSRVHGAIIRERISRASSDRGRHERDERRLRDQRQTGYALLERIADAALTETSASDPPTADPDVVVRVLGEHTVEVDGRTVRRGEWKSKKALEVLTVLASRSPRGARRESLIEDVWPGRDPEKGRTLLRTALSEIRRMLEPGRPTGEPSSYLDTADDIIRLTGRLDLDLAEEEIADTPVTAFQRLEPGIAAEVESAEWAQDWIARVERLLVAAAATIPPDSSTPVRVAALESLITAEPWKRDHYDALAEVHRAAGDTAAAAEVERRWFADD